VAFVQSAPALGNTWSGDPLLPALLDEVLPRDVLAAAAPELEALGALAAGELYRLQLADRLNEPQLTHWDAWGNRVDRVEVTALWRESEVLAARHGLVADAYERTHGRYARIVQFAKVYLFAPSTDVYSCPLAMTDGAARALIDSGNEALVARAVPHLTSRDPATFWTSGQWMTESTGGSDVGLTRTRAKQGPDGRWRLTGRKWFTSAISSQMALTLARPEGNPDGGKGLALFYLETRNGEGRLNGITVNRLKDKLGTRKVPTAELDLDGALAEPVAGLSDGVRRIAPMLNVTRTWNAVVAAALMRRGFALARDYAARRHAFGAVLAEKPLHVDTLAGLEVECRAALHLALFVAGLIGRTECGEAGPQQLEALRTLTPLVKLTTGRQAVTVLSEVVEAFGGAGYVEDTGIPALLRDAQVLPIWEGTTNVLALDALRVLRAGGLAAIGREARFALQQVREIELVGLSARVERAFESVQTRLGRAPGAGTDRLEADARRLALTLGRIFAAALMLRHAQWAADRGKGDPAKAAARRFVQSGLDCMTDHDPADAAILMRTMA